MTNQEMFDKAVAGLASQGFAKSGDDYNCFYNRDGKRCAFGWCLTEEQLQRAPEEKNAKHIINILNLNMDENAALRLQLTHDSSTSVEDMKARLVLFAERYNLTLPDALRPV